jgi:hypothetical protein
MEEDLVKTIKKFKTSELPNSSFNIFLGKRRSGKSVLAEFLLKEMLENKMINLCYLFSPTNAGFPLIDNDSRFTDIEPLHTILQNFRDMNKYNKVAKEKDKFKIKALIILDDFAIKLKTKELSCNGRHSAYAPLSLHFVILSQSLTKISRVTRLNADNIFFNTIPSRIELEMIMCENMYILDSSREGMKKARKLYHDLVISTPFQFIVLENHRQNCVEYSDYIKSYKAILDK